MNAYSTTARDLANALSGRAPQDVRIVRKSARYPKPESYVVLVGGEFYEVHSFTLGALQSGFTPEELELEPLPDFGGEEPDEDDEMDAYRAHKRWERDVTPRRL